MTANLADSMRITILALGSRGDVQPFVALAAALRARGHRIRIAAPQDYATLITDHGFSFHSLGGLIREQMDMQAVAAMLDGAGNPLRFAAGVLPQFRSLAQQLVADAWQAADDADALVVSTLGMYPGLSVAEKRCAPLFVAHFHPLAETSAEQHVNFPSWPAWLPLRSRYNRFTHFAGAHGLWQLLRRSLNRARSTILGLPPISPLQLIRRVQSVLAQPIYGYSRILAPLPPDTPAELPVTGFWFLPRAPGWEPDQRLADFLASGPAPVYIGFGSNLTGRTPDELTALYVEALHRTGQRGILFAGWGDFGNIPLPTSILRVEDAPHDWLFPQVAAAIHHGGAGVTAASVAAGVPSVAMPFLGDQFLWAQQLHRLGCGPSPLDRRHLTAEQLSATIGAMLSNPSFRTAACRLGAQVVAEDGANRAADWIERTIRARSQTACCP